VTRIGTLGLAEYLGACNDVEDVIADLVDRRGRKVDPEWANRRRLLTAHERLSDRSFVRMWNQLVAL